MKKGEANGCLGLYELLTKGGDGLRQDHKRALDVLEQACRSNLQPACFKLGMALTEGFGGKINTSLGLQLIEKSLLSKHWCSLL